MSKYTEQECISLNIPLYNGCVRFEAMHLLVINSFTKLGKTLARLTYLEVICETGSEMMRKRKPV